MKINTTLRRYIYHGSLNFWHFECSTKYLYQLMKRPELKNLVEACIRKVAQEQGINIKLLKDMSDHVQILVTLPHNMTYIDSKRHLKGSSAYIIFRNRDHLQLRYSQGQFWATGTYSVTLGYNNIDSIIKNIEKQEIRHGPASS